MKKIIILMVLFLIPFASAQSMSMDLELDKKTVRTGEKLRVIVTLENHLIEREYPVRLNYTIQDPESSEVLWSDLTMIYLKDSHTYPKLVPIDLESGYYNLHVKADYIGLDLKKTAIFYVKELWYMKKIDKYLKVWHLVGLGIVLLIILLAYRIQENVKGS
jgi:hypothetical protein